ncbi:MAG: Gfo/Idh/MocA family oxidoreductase [candidate division KSB1 bacterium]|nr:Gfo/Idh/MocA family oxidoreductase [candidate division KSB1 bacterium]
MNAAIRAALIGVGGYGRVLLRASRQVPGFAIVKAYYYHPERVREIEKQLGIPVTASFEEILEDPSIQALVIATPNDQHLPQAKAGLEHGKAVFVDKPITNYVSEAVELIRCEQKTGQLLMVGHNYRRMPAVRACERAIREGRIGELVSVEGNFSRGGAYEVTASSWRRQDRCPTGPMIQLGIHLIDAILNWCGTPLRVAGAMEKLYREGQNVDNTACLIEFSSGRLATVQSNYLGPFWGLLRAYGTRGIVETDSLSTVLYTESGGKEILYQGFSSFDLERDISLKEQFEEFARLIQDGGHPETDSVSSMLALAVVNAMEISAEEKRFVSISELIPTDLLPESTERVTVTAPK